MNVSKTDMRWVGALILAGVISGIGLHRWLTSENQWGVKVALFFLALILFIFGLVAALAEYDDRRSGPISKSFLWATCLAGAIGLFTRPIMWLAPHAVLVIGIVLVLCAFVFGVYKWLKRERQRYLRK